MSIPSYFLNNRQLAICTYGGLAGVLLSVTAIIQLMVYGTSSWLVPAVLGAYCFIGISFFLLCLQKPFAPLLLLISSVLAFGAELAFVLTKAFSLVVVILFLYTVILVIFLYVEQISARLKQRSLALKQEQDAWAGKI